MVGVVNAVSSVLHGQQVALNACDMGKVIAISAVQRRSCLILQLLMLPCCKSKDHVEVRFVLSLPVTNQQSKFGESGCSRV